MPPTLSICIPTFNRAELLASALASLAPQIRELGDEVELIVSDNCSTDSTQEVVEQVARQCPIRYHRNDENVGVIGNFLGGVENLAAGEFCWMMGDDELVRAGAVRSVLEAIKEHTDVDYFYVNYSMDSFERRAGVFVTPEDFRDWKRTGNPNLETRRLERWESLVSEDFSAVTPIYCSVFRRSVWLRGARGLKPGEPFSSVDQTYPHAAIFARTMVGKPAWSSGYPWTIMCSKESWAEFIPVVVLVRFHELLDLYLKNGVKACLLDGHRRRMLTSAAEPLARVIQGERLPLLENFSVWRFILKHFRYMELWRAIFKAVVSVPARRVAQNSFPLAAFALPAKVLVRCSEWWKVRARLNL
jgi:hypothetical protein